MRRSTLAILLGLTIVLGLAGAWLVVERVRTTAADLSGRPLLPDLKARLNDVATITLTGAEGSFTLQRDAGERWILPERGGYPVDFGRVQRLLVALADMKAIEPKTAKPERYRFLDVEDIAPGTRGLRLTVKDGAGVIRADLIVGRPSEVMGATKVPRQFVRLVGEASSWEAEADLRLERQAAVWLDRELLVIAPDRFRRATVTRDGQTVRITRPKASDSFTVEGIDPAAASPKSGRIGALAVAATYLTLDDVRKAAEDPGKPLATVVYETFDGLVLTLDLTSIDGQGWATIAARFDPEAGAAAKDAGAPAGPDGQPLLKDAETVKAEAGAITARTAGWRYRIDGTRVIDLTPEAKDLSEPKPAPAASTPPGATPVPALPALPEMPQPPAQ
ncbi:DUF4340 domain-containing protein [Zavarzinia compransoris]|uniref:DUF4340 domain-containing protein n=1 Tax=Zavarzinia compransoris TaxID=1264899 RepID=A0A317E534_9PROT|nr:DUF4340 domain-containing protein [Zavarzinia compransoris]PWR21771.1 hypothetical protein DKG75_07215 [Zavarzinia compransoris]TDP45430.1 uncharacterized protein DUF4340 [Zavarzinia compransoris]